MKYINTLMTTDEIIINSNNTAIIFVTFLFIVTPLKQL